MGSETLVKLLGTADLHMNLQLPCIISVFSINPLQGCAKKGSQRNCLMILIAVLLHLLFDSESRICITNNRITYSQE